MSSEHKRPLYAFAIVALLCAVFVGNGLRSDALTGLLRAAELPARVLDAGPGAERTVASDPGVDVPAAPVTPAPAARAAIHPGIQGKSQAPGRGVAQRPERPGRAHVERDRHADRGRQAGRGQGAGSEDRGHRSEKGASGAHRARGRGHDHARGDDHARGRAHGEQRSERRRGECHESQDHESRRDESRGDRGSARGDRHGARGDRGHARGHRGHGRR